MIVTQSINPLSGPHQLKHLIRLAEAPFSALWDREQFAITSPIPGGIQRGDVFEAYEMHAGLPTSRVMILEIKRIRRRNDGKLHCQLAYMSNCYISRAHCRRRLKIDEVWAQSVMYPTPDQAEFDFVPMVA